MSSMEWYRKLGVRYKNGCFPNVLTGTQNHFKVKITGSIPVRATKSPLSCFWGVTMRIVARLAFLSLLSVTVLLGQANQKRIFLSPKSDITTAEIAEGFAKYCPDVAITQDAAKADYVLQAAETVSADKRTTTGFGASGPLMSAAHGTLCW